MPYALKNRCVIRSDTGETVRCHPTRAKALRHLAALKLNVPETKAQASGNPTGRMPMTRSEAARHASLVRWKKEQPLGKPNPAAIAARVKEILAEKAKKKEKKPKGAKPKGGGKGKGKGAAKPKDSRTPQEKANQNRAAVAKQGGMDKLEGTIVRLNAGMGKSDLEKDAHDELIKKGLAQRAADGTVTLSPAGKKWKSAADKGDIEGAQGALAEGQAGAANKEAKEKDKADKAQARTQAKAERQAAQAQRKAEREKAKAERLKKQKKAHKAMTDILEIKAGARHSKTDQQHVQGVHDSSVALGAVCGPGEDDGDTTLEDAGKAIKAMQDDPQYYAQHECSDVGNACSALANLTMLIQSELMEGDEDDTDVSQLVDACRILVTFISSELDELEGASSDSAETIGHEPMKAITAREDVSPADKKRAVAEYGDVTYADEKNKKYPLDSESHIRSAWNYIGQEKNQAMYSAGEVAAIKKKIIAAWKKKIDDAGPPSAGKAIDLIHVDGSAIKALEGDEIGGYAVLFGTAETPDLEKDFYTKSTDLWLDHFGWPRPITYHHGLDPATRDNPVVGHWLKATVDDTGVWMTGQLDKAHRYYKAIKELAQRGYLKLSSDSAPQWVLRERDQQTGANFVKRWPIVTSSVTVTPMEPRMLPVEVKAFLAELGLDAIDGNQEADDTEARERQDAAKADEDRARALSLELDLLELEMTL